MFSSIKDWAKLMGGSNMTAQSPSLAELLAQQAQQAYPANRPLTQSPITITTARGVIAICTETGNVSIPASMQISDASREFWNNLPAHFAPTIDAKVYRLADHKFHSWWGHAIRTRWPKLLREECDRAYAKGFYDAINRVDNGVTK
jgi:hypothetical protein